MAAPNQNQPNQNQNPPNQNPNGNNNQNQNPNQQNGNNNNQQNGNNNNQQNGNNNNQNPNGNNNQNPNGNNNQNPNGNNNQNQNPNANQNQQSSSSSSTLSIPGTLPAGGLVFTQPPQTAAQSYYKIAPSQLVTFAWNMTSVVVTPTHLTLSAFCAENGNTYPIGPTNGVIPGTQSSVVWDPWAYDQANPGTPLAVGTYTLSVWGDAGPTALAAPGLFSPNDELRFALYTTQPYTPLVSWTCQGCSAASPNTVARGFPVALVVTCVVLLLSGLGILRTAMGIRVREED